MTKIIVAGDYSPNNRVSQLINERRAVEVLKNISQTVQKADYAIVNFESVVISSKSKKIVKAGPGMHCTCDAVPILKAAGFDAVTLANNHFGDYGNDGVSNSIRTFKENGLEYFGGGMNINEANTTFVKDIAGTKVAFINVCEHEFSIATNTKAGSAPLDVIDVVQRITISKKEAEYVIVIVHGGNEYFQLPTPRMKKTYRFFIECGATTVINHHQHCFSGYEVYRMRPIFYGLGNFCFDWNNKRNGIWNQGYMVELKLNNGDIYFNLYPYEQCNERPIVKLLKGESMKSFNRRIIELNGIIADDKMLQAEYMKFCHKKKSTILSPFTPYMTSYARIATVHNILPKFIPKKKLTGLLNFIDCESHRDVLLKILNEKINKYNDR